MSTDNRRLMADISDYQDRFDAHAYASAGHMVIAIKALEAVSGGGGSHHGERADQAHAANCAVFHYHFGHPESPHEAQMRAFWDRVKPHWRKGDALVLDVERGLPDHAGTWAHNADNYLRGYSGHAPLGYTYESFLRDSFQIQSKHFWLAAYRSRPPAYLLGYGRVRKIWQYTDGIVGPTPHEFPGIGQCDGSVIGRRFARQIAKTIGR